MFCKDLIFCSCSTEVLFKKKSKSNFAAEVTCYSSLITVVMKVCLYCDLETTNIDISLSICNIYIYLVFTRDLGRCLFLASVAHPPQLLKGFACVVTYT